MICIKPNSIKNIKNRTFVETKNEIIYDGFLFTEKDEIINFDKNPEIFVFNYLSEFEIKYYFFTSLELRDIFARLISISNVGIKIIKNIFDSFTISEFIKIINEGDIDKLVTVPLIGSSLANSIIKNFREKYLEKKISTKGNQIINSIKSLGYRQSEIYKGINKLKIKKFNDSEISELFKYLGENVE